MKRKLDEYIYKRLLILKRTYKTLNPALCTGNFLWVIANEFYKAKCFRLANEFYKRSQKWHEQNKGCGS